MSRGATLTLRGLYSWNDGLFDLFKVPSGLSKREAVDVIILRAADLELLYPDWAYMRWVIGIWTTKNFDVWERLADTLAYDYDAISNYDRREEWTDEGMAERGGKSSSKSTTSAAAFNSSSMLDRESTEASANASETAESNSEHSGRVWGNIGVTSTQQLIEQEREISRYNIYDEIAESFVNDFCLLVY